MLFQVGGQGTRPTFFEMAAAQQLPASLRAALTYTIGVLALRRPFLSRVLDYEDECFALLMLALESHSLRTTDASFSESLYGLRRRAADIGVGQDVPQNAASNKLLQSGLEKRQKVLSVFLLVILPYIRSKLQAVYNKEREEMLRASLWGHEDADFDVLDSLTGNDDPRLNGISTAGLSLPAQLRKKIQKLIGACYPWLHATNEGLVFAYQLLYLLDATGFYSAGLHVLRIHVCRATGQELMDASFRISEIRRCECERLRGPPWLKAIQRALLMGVYTTLDYAQPGLIAAVFFFKMMEWWYQSAEGRMSSPTVYPPPPPPPPPKVADGGIPIPSDRTVCPLCLQKRQNPSVTTVSGFVFCYTCIFKYISQVWPQNDLSVGLVCANA